MLDATLDSSKRNPYRLPVLPFQGVSLGERVAASLRQGDHVLVEGTLVSSTYEHEYGKGKKTEKVKYTVLQIRDDSIRKLNRVEKEPEASVSGSDSEHQSKLGTPSSTLHSRSVAKLRASAKASIL